MVEVVKYAGTGRRKSSVARALMQCQEKQSFCL